MIWDVNVISAKILAPIIIIFGSIGNLLGLIIISNKKLNQMGPQKIFICMFVMDNIYFILIFHPYLANAFDINVTAMSNVACKLYWYARYSMAIISPMMNVYISAERFVSITFPSQKLFLLKEKIQIGYILVIISINLALAIQVALGFELQHITLQPLNQSEIIITYYCDFSSLYWQDVVGFIDMVIRVIIPAGLMIIFSILLSWSIFRSRNKFTNSSANVKDIRFSMVCMTLNLFYILFSLPVSVVVLLQDYSGNEYYVGFSILFFVAYCANFYLMFAFNRVFRRTFFQMIFNSSLKKNVSNQMNEFASRNRTV